MARSGYLKVTGEASGEVQGSVKQKNRENWIEVIALNHEVLVPTDIQSGQQYGRRQHKPVIITKPLDKSSPVLFSMMCRGENAPKVTLEFNAISPQGGEVPFYRVELVNARIIGIKSSMLNVRDEVLAKMPQTEEISFAYQEITVTFLDGNISANDSWLQREA